MSEHTHTKPVGWQEAGFTCCTVSPWAWDLLPKDGVSKVSEKLHPLIAVFQTVNSASQAMFLRALVPLSKIDSDLVDPGVRDRLSLGNADVRGYVKGPEKPCSKGTSVLQTALMKEPLFWYYCVQPEGPWGFLEHSRGGQAGSDDPGGSFSPGPWVGWASILEIWRGQRNKGLPAVALLLR